MRKKEGKTHRRREGSRKEGKQAPQATASKAIDGTHCSNRNSKNHNGKENEKSKYNFTSALQYLYLVHFVHYMCQKLETEIVVS